MIKWGLIAGLILLAALTGVWFWPGAQRAATAVTPAQAVPASPPVALSSALWSGSAPNAAVAPPAALRDRFAKATNYWQFANGLAPAAQAGDRDSQYYLWRAMRWCEDENRFDFERKHRQLTLEEGLAESQRLRTPLQLARLTYARCHEFQQRDDSSLGRSSEWLAAATESRQPAAQAATALQLLLQQVMDSNAREAGLTPPVDQENRIDNSVDPHVLLREAVESADPEVLRAIADAQGMLNPNQQDNTSEFAWLLLACRAGLDCSADADWVMTVCNWMPSCTATGGTNEVLQGLAGERWQAVQDQAMRLRAQLDSRSWDQLGLGAP